MLKLKATFHIHINSIDNQVQKNILHKFIEQVAHCVLNDIHEKSTKAEGEENNEGFIRENLLTPS